MEPLELFDSIMTLDEEGKDATELVSELQRWAQKEIRQRNSS